MKKIGTIFIGLLMASPLFSQSDVKLSVCGKTTIEISGLDKCRSVEVDQDGFKVYGFVLRYVVEENKMIKEFKSETNELSNEAIEAIKLDQPAKLYIEEINLINANGEASEVEPLIVEIK